MENDNLIKKLERTELPDIEIPGHKRKLKQALMQWKYQEKEVGVGFRIFKKIALPIGTVASLVVIAVLLSNILFPQYTLAEAREIALRDPQIREWIDMGAEIKDIEIIKNRAYVLVSPKAPSMETQQPIGEPQKYKFEGVLVEIKMRTKEIAKIEAIVPQIIPLTDYEKENVRKIIQDSEILKNEARAIEIINIEPIPAPSYRLRLRVRDKGVEILPEKPEYRKVRVIYDINGERKKGKVNVTEQRIEILEVYKKREKEQE